VVPVNTVLRKFFSDKAVDMLVSLYRPTPRVFGQDYRKGLFCRQNVGTVN